MSSNGQVRDGIADGGVLRWTGRVLAADDLRRSLNGHRELVLPRRAIITPLASHSTRMLPTVVERRCRVNVSGVVTPSPVGVAMLKLRYPSPPLPSPAMLGPFWINSVVSISRPMRVMVSRLREWMMLVCLKP